MQLLNWKRLSSLLNLEQESEGTYRGKLEKGPFFTGDKAVLVLLCNELLLFISFAVEAKELHV